MDDFSLARPKSEEGASQGAQSCKAYVSSPLAFCITALWGAQSRNTVVSNRFAFRSTTSWGTQSHGHFAPFCVSRGAQSRTFGCANNTYIVCRAMVLRYCVSRGNARNQLTHALRTPPKKNSLGDGPIYDFHYKIHFSRHRLHCVPPKPLAIA